MTFLPYFFQGYEAKNRVLKILDNIEDSNDVDYIIVTIISDPILNPSIIDLLDREPESSTESTEPDSDVFSKAKLHPIEETKLTPEDAKDISTYLIEELNSLIG